jgi:hypothetical protein
MTGTLAPVRVVPQELLALGLDEARGLDDEHPVARQAAPTATAAQAVTRLTVRIPFHA